ASTQVIPGANPGETETLGALSRCVCVIEFGVFFNRYRPLGSPITNNCIIVWRTEISCVPLAVHIFYVQPCGHHGSAISFLSVQRGSPRHGHPKPVPAQAGWLPPAR